MSDDIKALKEALEAGPTPGEWYEHHDKGRLYIENVDDVVCDMGLGVKSSPTSRYIAACYPARIARLLERLEKAERDAEAKQARIDALMLEHCPDEMASEQIANWAVHQVPNEPAPPLVAMQQETQR